MPRTNEIYGGDSLTGSDIPVGVQVSVTIASSRVQDFDDGSKVVLSFVGKKKTLVVNFTNATTIANMYGDEINNWKGKPITLYHDPNVRFGNKIVGGIRVREYVSSQYQPQPVPRSHQPQSPQRPPQPVENEWASEPMPAGNGTGQGEYYPPQPAAQPMTDDDIPF